MKRAYASLLILSLFASNMGFAQKPGYSRIEKTITRAETESQLRFLAADEMRGRATGSPELNIAANYIASLFQQMGLSTVPGANGYFQQVPVEEQDAPSDAKLWIGPATLSLKTDLLVVDGGPVDISGETVLLKRNGDISGDFKGKIVVHVLDADELQSFSKTRTASNERYEKLGLVGAKALIEVVQGLPTSWEALQDRYGGLRTFNHKDGLSMPRVWLKSKDQDWLRTLETQGTGSAILKIQRSAPRILDTKNVLGMVVGTDKKLKDEYLVVCGHYDHVGVGKPVNGDSIYNGARDDAMGTVAMLAAAKYLSANPPKRSVIFMACTGEERGLLGSEWYAGHPLVPLDKTGFVLAADGAGYNDTTFVIALGYGRLDHVEPFDLMGKATGLKVKENPNPKADFYAGSDNFPFARRGVPAVDLSPAFTAFDAEITKYYHQPADEVGTLNFSYVVKYVRAFACAAEQLCNAGMLPSWKAGDPFMKK